MAADARLPQQEERRQIHRAVGQSRAGKACKGRGRSVAPREHGGIVDLLVDVDQQDQVGDACAAEMNDQRIALVAERKSHEGMRVLMGKHGCIVRQQDAEQAESAEAGLRPHPRSPWGVPPDTA